MADGIPAPHRPRPAVRDLRRGHDAAGSIPAHGRLRPRGSRRVGPASRPAQSQVDAYVAGVNAFIATHHGSRLPPEFSLLRFEPEPWSGPDVVVWVEDDGVGSERELFVRAAAPRLAGKVGAERMAELLPPYARDGLSILTEGEAAPLRFPASNIGGSGRRARHSRR